MSPTPSRPIDPLGANSFAQGGMMPIRAAFHLLKRPGLWPLVLIPLVLNILLFTGLMMWGFGAFAQMLQESLGTAPGWFGSFLGGILKFVFWIVALAAVYFVFTPMALVIAAPFNDRIAELTERDAGFGLAEDGRSLFRAVVQGALVSIGCEVRRLSLFGLVFLCLLPLNLIPVVGNVLYATIAFVWAMRTAPLEFMGFAADRRLIGFGQRWRMTRERRALTMGYGLVTIGLFMIPFLNVLVVPISAVSGTWLYGRLSGEMKG